LKHSLTTWLFVPPIDVLVTNPWNYVDMKDIPAQMR